MKRWTLLLLLLVLPLTMAPRTSWTTDAGYDLHGETPLGDVRVGAAVPLTLTVDSYADDPVDAVFVVSGAVHEAKDTVRFVAASRWCDVVESTRVVCEVEGVEPHGEQTVRIVARPLEAGRLTFRIIHLNREVSEFTINVLDPPGRR